jgi:signal transduction histidine kinase
VEAARPDKRITLRVYPSSPGRVAIVVRDNGVGIAAENLQRVFAFGFSTRGSLGYGLHWAAIAAGEMGGSLTGASDGPGKGATFTLDLPLGEAAREPAAAG